MKRPNICPIVAILCVSSVCSAALFIAGIYESRQRQMECNLIRDMVDDEMKRVRALAENPTFKPGITFGQQIWTGCDFRGVITNYPAQ